MSLVADQADLQTPARKGKRHRRTAERFEELQHFDLNPDATMINASAMVSLLFGSRVTFEQASPFRQRMPRLWQLAGIPYETIQKGSAQDGVRGRTDHAITIRNALTAFDFAQEYGLYVPGELAGVTRQRDPQPLVRVPVDAQKQELQDENARLRAMLAEAGIAV